MAGPFCPTQSLSNFLGIIPKPLYKAIPCFILEDMDSLIHTPNTIKANTHQVSFDVTSLYTNIPHNLGSNAIEK